MTACSFVEWAKFVMDIDQLVPPTVFRELQDGDLGALDSAAPAQTLLHMRGGLALKPLRFRRNGYLHHCSGRTGLGSVGDPKSRREFGRIMLPAEVAQLVEQWSEEGLRFANLLHNSRLIPKFSDETPWSNSLELVRAGRSLSARVQAMQTSGIDSRDRERAATHRGVLRVDADSVALACPSEPSSHADCRVDAT